MPADWPGPVRPPPEDALEDQEPPPGATHETDREPEPVRPPPGAPGPQPTESLRPPAQLQAPEDPTGTSGPPEEDDPKIEEILRLLAAVHTTTQAHTRTLDELTRTIEDQDAKLLEVQQVVSTVAEMVQNLEMVTN